MTRKEDLWLVNALVIDMYLTNLMFFFKKHSIHLDDRILSKSIHLMDFCALLMLFCMTVSYSVDMRFGYIYKGMIVTLLMVREDHCARHTIEILGFIKRGFYRVKVHVAF